MTANFPQIFEFLDLLFRYVNCVCEQRFDVSMGKMFLKHELQLRKLDGKLSQLRLKGRSHKYSNLERAGDRTGDLVIGRQRSY